MRVADTAEVKIENCDARPLLLRALSVSSLLGSILRLLSNLVCGCCRISLGDWETDRQTSCNQGK
ncbi:MAG: hypothetical protein BRC58_00970 [Cyanobacteria bacterium QS_8_64_29]|nr:MAG: hypothetical protein BRC58_00970 [Cyanobacteria bacterium QS_8_64_29]